MRYRAPNIPTTSEAHVGVGVKSDGTRADALAERQSRVKTDVYLWCRKTPIYVTNATDVATYHAIDAVAYHATGVMGHNAPSLMICF